MLKIVASLLRWSWQSQYVYGTVHGIKWQKYLSYEAMVHAGNTKGGSITVPLTSCLTGLELAVRQLPLFCFYLQNRLIQISQTGGQWYSDPPLVFPGRCHVRFKPSFRYFRFRLFAFVFPGFPHSRVYFASKKKKKKWKENFLKKSKKRFNNFWVS